MMRSLTAVGAMLGVLLAAPLAEAQGRPGESFGEKGQFIVSADRLLPLFAYTSDVLTDNRSVTTSFSGTSISLLWGGNSVTGYTPGNLAFAGIGNFYTIPRIGVDYVVIPHLTVGGDLMVFFTLGGNNTVGPSNQQVKSANPTGNAFGLAPRVGYVLDLSSVFSVWLRGGLSVYTQNISQPAPLPGCGNATNDTNVNVWGLDLDPQLVISPVSHVGITVGPTLDWGFAGGASYTQNGIPTCNQQTKTSYGYNALFFGITAGLVGYL
jgi:hypothetical protein